MKQCFNNMEMYRGMTNLVVFQAMTDVALFQGMTDVALYQGMTDVALYQGMTDVALYQGMTSVVPKELQVLIWALAPAGTALPSDGSPADEVVISAQHLSSASAKPGLNNAPI
jgi:hypothetical protein